MVNSTNNSNTEHYSEATQLADPSYLLFYKNRDERILWLDSAVDETWLEYEKQILLWNLEDKHLAPEKRKPIKLLIFSYGGLLDVNYSFIDMIKKSKTPIIGVNMGQACSAACFIYIACHKRYAMPNSSFLIHQGGAENGFSGTYNQVVSAIMEYQRQIDELGKYLIDNTKITEDVLAEKFDSEWFLTAEEAIKYGVCDKIIDDIDEIYG